MPSNAGLTVTGGQDDVWISPMAGDMVVNNSAMATAAVTLIATTVSAP